MLHACIKILVNFKTSYTWLPPRCTYVDTVLRLHFVSYEICFWLCPLTCFSEEVALGYLLGWNRTLFRHSCVFWSALCGCSEMPLVVFSELLIPLETHVLLKWYSTDVHFTTDSSSLRFALASALVPVGFSFLHFCLSISLMDESKKLK